jgi:hypothetical protein
VRKAEINPLDFPKFAKSFLHTTTVSPQLSNVTKMSQVFVSYAWESSNHKLWVKELAVRLRLDGIGVILDQWELAPGDQLAEFMEKSIRTSDSVLIICTPAYKLKSDVRAGGVGYEGTVITAELLTGSARRKFIPLHRAGEWKDAAPSWLLGSFYLDFRRSGDDLEDAYFDLLTTLQGKREAAPPIGSPRFPRQHRNEIIRPIGHDSTSSKNDGAGAFPFVLQKLLESGQHDPTLIERGRDWLIRTPQNDPAWPQIWNSLINSRPNDAELNHMGRYWLRQTAQGDPAWTHVWNALMNIQPEDPELIELGQQWLTKN